MKELLHIKKVFISLLKQNRNIMINYNEEDKEKALKLASELKFDDENITDVHSETLLSIFNDDNGGTWSIEATYKGCYNLCYDGDKIEKLNKSLELEIDGYVRENLNEEYNNKHDEDIFRDFQNELWRKYGPGKI